MFPFSLVLRQTWRSLVRSPGYVAAASLTLAMGLAAALGAFAPAWDLLAFPFDIQAPGRVVAVSAEGRDRGDFLRPIAAADVKVLQQELVGLAQLGACRDDWPQVQFPEGPKEMRTARVNPAFFAAMGLPLHLGRGFESSEMLPGSRVLVLEHGFWMSHFGGKPDVLGRTLNLDGMDHEIIGVLAPQRRLPYFLGDAIAFQPLVVPAHEPKLPCWIFGRLSEGTSLTQLQGELDRLSPNLGPPRPAADGSWRIRAVGLLEHWRARMAPGQILSLVAGLLILLLACTNAAHLMLARHLERTREWGLRAALGSGAQALWQPILTESFLVVLVGALVALPLLHGFQALGFFGSVGLKADVLVPASVVLALALALTSLLPLRWAIRLDLTEALREGGGASASKSSTRLRGGLASLQVALAFALLVAAGLSLRALERLQGTDPGYATRDMYVAQLKLEMPPGEDFMSRSRAFQRHLREEAPGITGIQAVAMSDTRPLVDQGHENDVWADTGEGARRAGVHSVSPEYFITLGIPMLAGRNLEETDRDVCIVSGALARRHWGTDSPLGHQLRLGSASAPPLKVVGVVGEARMGRFTKEAIPAVYTPLAQSGRGYQTLYVRSSLPLTTLKTSLGELCKSLDAHARLIEIERLETRIERELAGPRHLRRQTLAASLLASLLAGIGLVGTLGQMLIRQRKEWGIRAALGAGPAQLAQEVFLSLLTILIPGCTLGLLLAWGLGRLLSNQLHGVNPADPTDLGQALLLLGLTGLFATLGPLIHLLRVQPAQALRQE